jgi:hypothetical protein
MVRPGKQAYSESVRTGVLLWHPGDALDADAHVVVTIGRSDLEGCFARIQGRNHYNRCVDRQTDAPPENGLAGAAEFPA